MPEEPDNRAVPRRRLEVLHVLKQAPGPMSIHDVAGRLGVHPNTARFHLEALVENGQVERVAVDRRTTGRPPLLFRPVPGMDPTGPRRYRLLAELLLQVLARDPDRQARAVESGRAWGYRQGSTSSGGDGGGADGPDPVARLVDLLDEVGFAPERRDSAEGMQIGLRHCPFLELAGSGSEIVCSIHLGLMQGAMQAWGSARTVDRLEPYVEPDLCLAHVT